MKALWLAGALLLVCVSAALSSGYSDFNNGVAAGNRDQEKRRSGP
jgi:hypothetical protein